MADPNISVALTIQHEGGFVNNPADPGGATKYGVEQRDIPNTPIQTLTVEQATEYYLQNYVKPFYAQIASQVMLDKLVDMGVLFGVGTAIKILQGVLGVSIDGNFGPQSLALLNTLTVPSAGSILTEYKARLHTYAAEVVGSHPQEGIFLRGWQNRIDS